MVVDVEVRNASAGQAALLPVHVSATSQAPAAARHIVPAAANVQLAAQHEPAAPLLAPRSQSSPASTTPLPHAAVSAACARATGDGARSLPHAASVSTITSPAQILEKGMRRAL
jgi:hypothetical protein